MDPDNVFNLFENEDTSDIIMSSKELEQKLEKFKDSPTAKIGMFVKLILNHQVFYSKLENFLKEEEPSYNIESTRESSEFIVYNKAWFYLKQIDINKKEDTFALLDFNPNILGKVLQKSILYFENREEYLKCAHILKIQHILKESKK